MPDHNAKQNIINFCLSKDLHIPFRLKLIGLSGFTKQLFDIIYKTTTDGLDEGTARVVRAKIENTIDDRCSLIATISIESGIGKRLTCSVVTTIEFSSSVYVGTNIRGSRGKHTQVNEEHKENSWTNLPIDYSKLPLDSRLTIKLYSSEPRSGRRLFIGYTTLNLFDLEKGYTLQTGHHSLEVTIMGKTGVKNGAANVSPRTKKLSSTLSRLEEKLEEKRNGKLPNVDWLDKLSYDAIAKLNLEEIQRIKEFSANIPIEELPRHGALFVNIELVKFEMPIVFSDIKYAPLRIPTSTSALENGEMTAINGRETNGLNLRTGTNDFNKITYDNKKEFNEHPSFTIFDPEQYRVNISEDPIEYKFRKLERTHQLSSMDKDLKPTLKVRAKLDAILKKQFFEKLSQQEKNLIWKFRFFLLNGLVINGSNEQYNNFIINFIKCIDWDGDFEVKEFLTIIKDLDTRSGGSNLFIQELTIVDCLELLSKVYRNKIVRGMAIQRLTMASDEDLELFMVQLVHSIQNEQEITINEFDEERRASESKYDDFVDEFEAALLHGAAKNGYQLVEKESDMADDAAIRLLYSPRLFELSKNTATIPQLASPLSDFIIERTLQNPALANYFFWNLKVMVDEEKSRNSDRQSNFMDTNVVTVFGEGEGERDNVYGNRIQMAGTNPHTKYQERFHHVHLYERVLFTFIIRLANSGEGSHHRITTLRRQVELVRQLRGISMRIKTEYKKEPTPKKIEILKRLLREKHKRSLLGGKAQGKQTRSRSSSAASALESMGLSISNRLGSKNTVGRVSSEEEYDSDQEGSSEVRIDRTESRRLRNSEDRLENETRSSSGSSTSSQTSGSLTRFSPSGSHLHQRVRHNRAFGIEYESLLTFPPIPFPLDPRISVHGSIPEHCNVFKSSLSPLKVSFKADTPSAEYPVMYKIGDDLRQDQFVTQIITLMNKILKSENLDLKLSPYRILATGPVEGLIQFVPNSSLWSILSKYNNSILAFLQKYSPDPNAPHKVKAEVMDTYVRSCAGYCVITYILGVGDRHLENLLLTKDGYFFHADFGYILGADPKPFPPLMKLPIQIIEGMGGLDDENYQKFCNYCYITYLTLRRNASIVLNLFQLMINTSVPALRTIDPDNESEKMEIIWKVQEKFMLNLDDEGAVRHIQRLIDDSVNAVYPVVIDRLHSMAQYWRS